MAPPRASRRDQAPGRWVIADRDPAGLNLLRLCIGSAIRAEVSTTRAPSTAPGRSPGARRRPLLLPFDEPCRIDADPSAPPSPPGWGPCRCALRGCFGDRAPRPSMIAEAGSPDQENVAWNVPNCEGREPPVAA